MGDKKPVSSSNSRLVRIEQAKTPFMLPKPVPATPKK
jgi:hypothetical protein